MAAVATPLFLDRLAERAEYAVIGPVDGRRQVLNTRGEPYRAICHLDRCFGTARCSGCTGFLIAPRLVLTAGHCLFSPLRRLLGSRPSPISIEVAPGRAGQAQWPFGAVQAVRWWVHSEYLRNGARPFDVGLIELADAPDGVTPLGLHALAGPELEPVRQRRLLHVSGYPADKPRGTQWEHEERLDLSTVRELFYSIDTCPGHSGAPVWIERWPAGTPRSVVAIHTAGPRPHRRGAWGCRAGVPMAPHGHLNRGVRVTPELLDAVHGIRRGARPLLFRLVEARGQRASAPAAHIDTA